MCFYLNSRHCLRRDFTVKAKSCFVDQTFNTDFVAKKVIPLEEQPRLNKGSVTSSACYN